VLLLCVDQLGVLELSSFLHVRFYSILLHLISGCHCDKDVTVGFEKLLSGKSFWLFVHIHCFQVVKSAPKGRYKGIKRNYEVEDVLKLRGSIDIEYTLATRGANKLWQLIHTEPFVPALGALTGNQAVQMVRAGLKAIYLSGKILDYLD
jgi:hypothetical protein